MRMREVKANAYGRNPFYLRIGWFSHYVLWQWVWTVATDTTLTNCLE